MGNCLFYLTIKGGTYSMPKLNLGKVVWWQRRFFRVFEDFTPEQLDGLTPKCWKGNVTTLDPDQNATVDIRKDGLNNYIDFGIPRGKMVRKSKASQQKMLKWPTEYTGKRYDCSKRKYFRNWRPPHSTIPQAHTPHWLNLTPLPKQPATPSKVIPAYSPPRIWKKAYLPLYRV